MQSEKPIVELSSAQTALLDGDLLRGFLAFAENLNFTRAARAVGLSQPALFERVQQLQELVGRPLYARDEGAPRALVLTPDGVALSAYAREALRRAAQAAAQLQGQPAVDEVRLVAGEGAWLYILSRALPRLPPTLRGMVRPATLGGPDSLAALRQGDVDLACCAVDVPPRGLASLTLLSTPMCVALRRGDPLARRASLRLAELRDRRVILAPSGQRHRDVVGRALAQSQHGLEDVLEADGWPLMLAYVAAGLGLAFVNGVCQHPQLKLVRVPELGVVEYRLLWRGGDTHPSRDRLRAALVTAVRAQRRV
jgi:DNA-binding transcriptional LysR family regulator